MASTIGIVGRAVQPDEAVLNGMKRSRLSLQFIAYRMRHLILVQLVCVPVRTEDEHEAAFARPVQFGDSQTTLERLVDNYIAAQFSRRWA